MRCSKVLEQLSSKSSGEKKENLLNVRALLFYEKDCIICSRVSGSLLNDPVSENVFQFKHTFQRSLLWLGAATQESQHSGAALILPLLPSLVAGLVFFFVSELSCFQHFIFNLIFSTMFLSLLIKILLNFIEDVPVIVTNTVPYSRIQIFLQK